MKCRKIERHKTLLQRLNEELENRFERLGAIAYIVHISRKYWCENELCESDVHRFYDAKRILLGGEKFSFSEYSPERKRVERKYDGAEREYLDRDPTKDIPF